MRRMMLAALMVIGLAVLAGTPALAGGEETAFFHDKLSAYGKWHEVPGYGPAWSPDNLPLGWRPFSRGRWVWADRGLNWVSEEEWGWITFHYGRWAFVADYGWVWLPGTVWSPGWVAWREGDGLIGWSALPPGSYWEPWGGHRGFYPDYDRIDYFSWNFVPSGRLFDRDVNHRILRVSDNDSFLRRTSPLTEAFDADRLSGMIGDKVERFRTTELDQQALPAPKERLDEGRRELSVFRPSVRWSDARPSRVEAAPDGDDGDRLTGRDRYPGDERPAAGGKWSRPVSRGPAHEVQRSIGRGRSETSEERSFGNESGRFRSGGEDGRIDRDSGRRSESRSESRSIRRSSRPDRSEGRSVQRERGDRGGRGGARSRSRT